MKFLLSLIRVGTFSVQNFVRNFWLSFITITIFILTLITVNVVLVMNVLADAALRSVEEKVEVSIYFNPEASQDIVQSAQGYLLGLDQVRDVRFVSSEDALQTFITRNQGNPVLLASLDEIDGNPFGHALIVSARSPEDFDFILESIQTPEYQPFIKETDKADYQAVIENINRLSERLKYGGVALIGFFSLVAVMIIFNTIRVAIYVHRDEIGIMKLVGANDWFIRGPFLIEAIFYSAIATALMIGMSFATFRALDPWLTRYFANIETGLTSYFIQNGLLIFGAQFICLSLLSLVTTYVAMRRYLRV